MVSWRTHDGQRQTKSSGSTLKGDAENFLDEQLGKKAGGEHVTAANLKLTFADAAADVITMYENKGRKSIDELRRRIKLHIEPFFGRKRPMVTITTSSINDYIAARRAATIRTRKAHTVRVLECNKKVKRLVPEERRPVSPAEINRELGVLRLMFTTAAKNRGFRHRPHIEMLKEADARQGFFSRQEVQEVCAHLPIELAAVVMFGFMTSWRASEIISLTWDRVDFTGRGRVWLNPGMTKSGAARTFKMTTELRALLKTQEARRDELLVGEREGGTSSSDVANGGHLKPR